MTDKKRSSIAVVPARGGSKRIKNKNILDFCGRPMISYVLEAAKESSVFDCIHVSTESETVKDVVETLGFPVDFLRDSSLSDDHTPLVPVLVWVLEKYREMGREFDDVWLVMPCAPLLEANDFRGCRDVYAAHGFRYPVLTVAEYPVPVEWAFTRADSGRLTPCEPGKFAVRSQDLGKKYFDAGAIAVWSTETLLSGKPVSDKDFVSHVLPKDKVVDIDEPSDLELARLLYLGRRAQ